ncbi:MAG: HEAT repeat domain-containing protein, partial [Oligoflexia bacterium]|nr:HEAT repeat domain-containing protein [Oligoflexia bacterium]
METIITKEKLEDLQLDTDRFHFFFKSKNNKEIIHLLNKLGKLPDSFDENILLYFVKNEHPTIRYLAVKNLGKLNRPSLLSTFKKLILSDNSSSVRREATSAIGRMRNVRAIPFLIKLLKDSDPEITLQAIRALIVFKDKKEILAELKKMKTHPNEIIQDIIKTELFQTNRSQKKSAHTQFPEKLKNRVVLGDIEDVVKNIPDESIHLTFTSPPYYNAR